MHQRLWDHSSRKSAYRIVGPSPTPTAPTKRETGEIALGHEIIGKDGAPMVLILAGNFGWGRRTGKGTKTSIPATALGSAFSRDKYEVTNKRFEQFVRETGHRTTAGTRANLTRSHLRASLRRSAGLIGEPRRRDGVRFQPSRAPCRFRIVGRMRPPTAVGQANDCRPRRSLNMRRVPARGRSTGGEMRSAAHGGWPTLPMIREATILELVHHDRI